MPLPTQQPSWNPCTLSGRAAINLWRLHGPMTAGAAVPCHRVRGKKGSAPVPCSPWCDSAAYPSTPLQPDFSSAMDLAWPSSRMPVTRGGE